MSNDHTPAARPALAGSLKRGLIKLAIGLTAIWVTVFIVDQKNRQQAAPPPIQGETPAP